MRYALDERITMLKEEVSLLRLHLMQHAEYHESLLKSLEKRLVDIEEISNLMATVSRNGVGHLEKKDRQLVRKFLTVAKNATGANHASD
jgi:hypothetical protein